ncbi:hypothetical protein HY632_02515 [Candidatus Uhrbacteria bacterium]|nr:hypothetical protein [Candidatus Uhrbacteria bacterium]
MTPLLFAITATTSAVLALPDAPSAIEVASPQELTNGKMNATTTSRPCTPDGICVA